MEKGRKTELVVITAEDRDKNAHYFLTEKSAFDIEWWVMRAFRAMTKAGVDIGTYAAYGLKGVFMMGAEKFMNHLATIDPGEAKPLLDEMLECAKYIPDPVHNPTFMRPIVGRGAIDGDVQEVSTLLFLRVKIMSLHLGFSIPGSNSKT